jgi:hypothetical protein
MGIHAEPSIPGDRAHGRGDMSITNSVSVSIACASCHRGVNLECEGPPGFWGYQTYNEYFCPFCRKQNHALTLGAVVSTRAG